MFRRYQKISVEKSLKFRTTRVGILKTRTYIKLVIGLLITFGGRLLGFYADISVTILACIVFNREINNIAVNPHAHIETRLRTYSKDFLLHSGIIDKLPKFLVGRIDRHDKTHLLSNPSCFYTPGSGMSLYADSAVHRMRIAPRHDGLSKIEHRHAYASPQWSFCRMISANVWSAACMTSTLKDALASTTGDPTSRRAERPSRAMRT